MDSDEVFYLIEVDFVHHADDSKQIPIEAYSGQDDDDKENQHEIDNTKQPKITTEQTERIELFYRGKKSCLLSRVVPMYRCYIYVFVQTIPKY